MMPVSAWGGEAAYATKKEIAMQYLRELVISGALKPGERVMQQEVAEHLGTSVTPVREAIRQLETEGYLESVAHVAVRVAQPQRDDLTEVYGLRRQLEGALVAEAARRITASELDEVEHLARTFETAAADGDPIAARRENYLFHLAVFRAAHRPVTLQLVNALWAKVPWESLDDVRGRARASSREHEVLVGALRARDPSAARKAAHEHMARSRHYIRAMRRSAAAPSTSIDS